MPPKPLGPCTRCGQADAIDEDDLRCLACQVLVDGNFDARRVLKIVELLRLEGLPQSALDPIVMWVADRSLERSLPRGIMG